MMKNIINNIRNISKKKLFIISITLIVLIILGIFLIINSIPKELDDILENNDYKIVSEYKAGSKIGDITLTRNTTEYEKDKTSLMIYEFNDIKEIKKEGTRIYKQYKDNTGFTTTHKEEKKYIYICACDKYQCFYTLGYDTELIQTVVNVKLKNDVDKIFNDIMKGKKLI